MPLAWIWMGNQPELFFRHYDASTGEGGQMTDARFWCSLSDFQGSLGQEATWNNPNMQFFRKRPSPILTSNFLMFYEILHPPSLTWNPKKLFFVWMIFLEGKHFQILCPMLCFGLEALPKSGPQVPGLRAVMKRVAWWCRPRMLLLSV